MADVRTNVVLSAETKGFDKALRQTLGINEAALKGLKGQAASYKTVQKEISGYQGKLDELAKTQLKLSKEMEATGDKGTEAYKSLKNTLRDVNREARDTERVISGLDKAHRREADAVKTLGAAQKRVSDQRQQDAKQARGGFVQGMMQSMPLPAPFLQRGPGMYRQAAGMMVGGALRRGVGGAGAAMFGGVGGLQQALSALPGGGIIAGQLGAASGFAGQALQYQRQRVGMAPYIGATESGAELAGARRRLGAFQKRTRKLSAGELATREFAAGGVMLPGGGFASPESFEGEQLLRGRERLAAQGRGPTYRVPWTERRVGEERDAQYKARISRSERREARLTESVAEARKRTIGGMGVRIRGISKQEAMQEAAAITQAAGGQYTGAAGQRRFMETAMAARTRFGIGPDVAGAFGAGARRGGLVGASGRGPEALTEALADAMKLGLEGSEINTYMQMTAQGIQRFEQTGIPFKRESVNAMAMELSKAGIAGTRAARMAGGFQQYVSGMGQRGISGGLDIMLLQEFGGYTGKGGAKELKRAMIQAEEGAAKLKEGGVGALERGGPMMSVIKKLMAMRGGGESGEFFMRGQLGGMGIAMSTREMDLIAKKARGEGFTKDDRAYVEREAARRKRGALAVAAGKLGTPEGLIDEAMGLIPASLKKQAEIANTQLAVGKKMLPTIQNLEKSSININKIFTTLAGEPLTKMTKAMEEFTAELGKAKDIADVAKATLGLVGIG